uniref:Calcium uptake protein 3, mitochondrial n=1 Tax=Cacopsylla melanoneura TaxID=428564 RepID=A0A8D8VHJ5_9HEMI
MSLLCRHLRFSRYLKSSLPVRFYSNVPQSKSLQAWKICLGVAAGMGSMYWALGFKEKSAVHAYRAPRKREDELLSKAVKLTSREKRFIKFASVEFDGQLYMTPQDFLESFVEDEPRPRLKRRVLTQKELKCIKDETPTFHKGSTQLFRTLRDKGIISYTEYLFLLTILTKPQTGFRIAFNMFDTDGNQRVDKNEFLVFIQMIVDTSKDERDKFAGRFPFEHPPEIPPKSPESIMLNGSVDYVMEKIFSHAWKDKRGLSSDNNNELNSKDTSAEKDFVDDEQGLQRKHNVDTTLLVHFFGKTGDNELRYEGFRRFMENLQTEVLEMEFQEFAKGAEVISELDFARIMLRYTYLDIRVYDRYLDRLLERIKEQEGIPPGISFDEFRVFCQFLNNIEDFTIAMRMYTLADHPISKDEFHRAVKICTGTSLSQHLVHTVFAIFDEDGDGLLSYREFIAIMKDRLHRGFKSYAKTEGWESFKSCLKQELKSPS